MNRLQSFQNNLPTLYVLATPIGNLKEITPRMIETIENCDVLFCEDTRVSGHLLAHLAIKKPLYSAYENIEKQSAEKILSFLKEGKKVGLMSDAGYPGISDPGQKIIQTVINSSFNVVVVNGPCALISAIVASGFSTDHFYFYGFLQAKESARKKELENLKDFKNTLVFYQSPHKIKSCLENMLAIFGNRQACLCREMSKLYEEYIHGTLEEILSVSETLKGEMVLIVEGKKQQEPKGIDESFLLRIQERIQSGKKTKEAIREIAEEEGVSKNELYDFYHHGGNKNEG